MMTENQVFATFCTALDTAKSVMEIDDSWTVLARNPQNMVRTDGVILVDKISQRRRGFQNEKYVTNDDGTLTKVWEWIEEYRFQVSVARARRTDDAVATVTHDEVASELRAWLNSSDGAQALRNLGLAPLFVFDVTNQQYQDENQVYQYFSHFDVMIEVVQTKEFTTPHITAADLGIRHEPSCPAETSTDVQYDRIWEESSSD